VIELFIENADGFEGTKYLLTKLKN